MGYFSVSCAASHISIYGDDCVRFFFLWPHLSHRLSKNWKLPKISFDKTVVQDHIVGVSSCYTYATTFFTPFCLPLKGQYDDYGRIKNIEIDSNVLILEKFFGLNIGKIVEIVCSSKVFKDDSIGEKKKRILNNLSSMFVHEEIFHNLIRSSQLYREDYLLFREDLDYEKLYDDFRESVLWYESNLKKYKNKEEVHPDWNIFNNPMHYDCNRFMRKLKDWAFFEDLYRKSIVDNTLKKEFCDYYHFHDAFHACNQLFLPTCNGEQNGASKMTRELLKQSLEIVERRIKDGY